MQPFPKSVRFHFIRHAQSSANEKPDKIGGIDAILTEKGHEEAAQLAEFFATRASLLAPTHVRLLCSTMERSIRTCLPTAAHFHSDVRFDARLNEIARGEWEGLSRSEIYSGNTMRRLALQGMDHRPKGGESMHDVGGRMVDCVLDTLEDETLLDGSTVIVFSHGVAIKCFSQRALGLNPRDVFLHHLDNTSITTISCTPEHWVLERYNSLPHLAPAFTF